MRLGINLLKLTHIALSLDRGILSARIRISMRSSTPGRLRDTMIADNGESKQTIITRDAAEMSSWK
jgi:hypothetical protein